MNKLDMEAIKSYGNELNEYQLVLFYIIEALKVVILWRGHFPIGFGKCKVKIPIHSIIAFTMGIFVVENFNLIPSFALFSITWLLVACNEQRHKHPSPWYGALTGWEMWYALVIGDVWNETIVANEKQPLIDKYEKERNEKMKAITEKLDGQKKENEKMNFKFQSEEQETEEAADTDITTKTGGVSLNPLKPILLPIQQILGQVCVALRIGKSIVTWDESFYAFILANACLFAGIALIWVPWSWIIRWALRITVWLGLGPWTGYPLDYFIVRKLEADGDNQMKKFERAMEQRTSNLLLRKRQVAINKERAVKLRSFKRYMFGKYIVK